MAVKDHGKSSKVGWPPLLTVSSITVICIPGRTVRLHANDLLGLYSGYRQFFLSARNQTKPNLLPFKH